MWTLLLEIEVRLKVANTNLFIKSEDFSVASTTILFNFSTRNTIPCLRGSFTEIT